MADEAGFGNQITRAIKDLMEIERQVPKVLPEAVDDGAKMLLSLARQAVPVRYGDLKASGIVETSVKDSSPTKAAALVIFKMFYAGFQEYGVEYGSTKVPAQPFLRPAADRAEPLIQRHIERKVDAVIVRIKSR